MATAAVQRDGTRGGVLLGFIGVLAFSLTLPATRAAVPTLGAVFVGLGRALGAAAFAAAYLAYRRARRPNAGELRALAITATGVIFAFPLLAAIAMQTLPSSHGAVVAGLTPCATAVMAVWRAGERPSAMFWVGCVAGVISVLVFAAAEGAGMPQLADGLLLLGVVGGSLGYAEGAKLTRAWGEGSGILVISWVLVLAAPLVAVLMAGSMLAHGVPAFADVPIKAWLSFAYLSLISAYLGFFAWYAGLARGGVARVGQVQLIQPVLTLLWAALLLGEPLRGRTILAALLVIGSAALSVIGRTRR